MIDKVLSGGQTGADQAGLRAAKACGISTGGFLPKGCTTLSGPCPDLLAEYGMTEHAKPGYPPRTEANVQAADGTIRFAANFKSAGERCTLKAIKWFRKPYLDVDINNPPPIKDVRAWIEENNIVTLNIAGNSEETAPGIGEFVFKYLTELFT